MSESEVLKRLIHSVVVKHNESKPISVHIEATAGQIFLLLQEMQKSRNSPFGVTQDNIASYMKVGRTHVPMGSKRIHLLAAINYALFGDSTNLYVKDLNVAFNDVAITETIRNKVDQYIADQSRNRRIGNVLVAPDYQGIDPMDIDAQVRNATTGNALKAHLLYQSPVAADIWERVKLARSYSHLYGLCEQGLRDLIQSEGFKKRMAGLHVVFNLGAGSVFKDKVILQALSRVSTPDLTFVWVDASWAMLHKTIRQLDLAVAPDVRCVALLADFEHPGKLRRIYENSFPDRYLPEFWKPKAFFILGFTLSNLNEMSFFSEYASACSKGDLFVFPMQFIPKACRNDQTMLEKFKSKLLASYAFDEGIELSTAGLSLLRDYKPCHFPKPVVDEIEFNGATRSLCVKFSVVLKHKRDGDEITVVTARSIRHYEQDYLAFLNEKGFKKLPEESQEVGGVKTILVEYVG